MLNLEVKRNKTLSDENVKIYTEQISEDDLENIYQLAIKKHKYLTDILTNWPYSINKSSLK